MTTWSKLNALQLGKYAEYFAKMEFAKRGLDVYTAEVDDKGIDFIVRKGPTEYVDIQVKSVRDTNYVFMKKKDFVPRKNLFLVLILFEDDKELSLLLIPSLHWQTKSHPALVGRNYEGKKSQPEWGVSITKSNITEIKRIYAFDNQINSL